MKNRLYTKLGILLTLAIFAFGCASSGKQAMQDATNKVPTRAEFTRGLNANDAGAKAVNPDNWVKDFGSEQLDTLVKLALKNNPDLHAAAARWRQAQAQVTIAQAQLYPHLSGQLQVKRNDPGHGAITNTYSGQVNVQWEIDIWGQLAEQAASVHEQAISSKLTYEYARFSLAATVTQAWFTAIAAKKQLRVDKELLKIQENTARVATDKANGGAGTPLDASVTQANVALAKAAISSDKQAIEQSLRAIEMLIGKYPSATLSVTNKLPDLPGPVITGVPSQLLERRPDVEAANHLVAAAFHQKKYAQAARLPQITLTASLGAVLDPTDILWSVGAGLLQPLFEGGQIEAGEVLTEQAQREAVASYVSVGIQAFGEVEASLANGHYLELRLKQLTIASDHLRKASKIAEDRYEAGIITIQALTQTRSQYFSALAQKIGIQAQRLINRVNLYLALGGTPQKPAIAQASTQPTKDNSKQN